MRDSKSGFNRSGVDSTQREPGAEFGFLADFLHALSGIRFRFA
jgi:hypothetical protein